MRYWPSHRATGIISASLSIVVTLAAWVATSCAAEIVHVGFPEATSLSVAILGIGTKVGYFEKDGVDVQTVTLAGGAKMAQAMISGAIDIGIGGSTQLLFLAKGLPARAVAAVDDAPAPLAVTVAADGKISQIADLKGRRIAVTTAGSLTEWLAEQIAQHEGWKRDDLQYVPIGDMQSEVSALLVGQVDALVGNVEWAFKLDEEKRGRMLVDFKTILPGFPATMIFASDKFIKERPDVLRRFLAGWYDTIKYVAKNRGPALESMGATMRFSPGVLGKVYDIEISSLSQTGRFPENGKQLLKQAFAQEFSKVADYSELYDERFLPKQ
jgi:NitT/TauT family transport system substrate-binding protein